MQKPSKRPQSGQKKKPVRKRPVKNLTPFKLNHYVLRVLYILIGPAITLPILNETGPLRFIGLSLLFSGYHLFVLIFLELLPIFDAYLASEAPIKTLTPSQERFTKVAAVFFFALIGGFLGSMKILDRTIHGMPVFWACLAAGIGIAVFLIRRSVKKPFSFITSDNATYFGIGFLLGTPMLLCCLFFIPNKYIVTAAMHSKPISIEDKSVGSRGRRGGENHYIFLDLDGKSERITIGAAQYNALNDSAYCDLNKGIFGYYTIDRIKPRP